MPRGMNQNKALQRIAKLNHRNPMWKGDAVGYGALHEWVRARKAQPVLCESCKSGNAYDLANISQEYKRDLCDWEYLCRKCHMAKDGRLVKLQKAYKSPKVPSITEAQQRLFILLFENFGWTQLKIAKVFKCHRLIAHKAVRKTWKRCPFNANNPTQDAKENN